MLTNEKSRKARESYLRRISKMTPKELKEHKKIISKKRKIHYQNNKKEYIDRVKNYTKNLSPLKKKKREEYMFNYTRSYYRKNKDKILNTNDDIRLRSKYGIDYTYYLLLLESQEHKCAICKCQNCNNTTKSDKYPLYIDHNHETGRVRGLLCNGCNMILGHCYENREVLLEAVQYIQEDLLFNMIQNHPNYE